MRYVDSSVERLQVKTEGLEPERHRMVVNGRTVPMTRTERTGTAVAGVRFKAWQPRSGLHPMLPVDAPLDLRHLRQLDRPRRSVAASITSPIPAAATTRPFRSTPTRRRRGAWRAVEPRGHTPGDYRAPPEERNAVFPLTLDLRRPAGM